MSAFNFDKYGETLLSFVALIVVGQDLGFWPKGCKSPHILEFRESLLGCSFHKNIEFSKYSSCFFCNYDLRSPTKVL